MNNTYYQPALKDANNVRMLEEASILVKLDIYLDLKISLDITCDSDPPQTVQQLDTYYSTGLSFSL